MEASSAIWDATKIFCCFLNKKASYAYDLEKNLKLLEEKREKLQEKRNDVEANFEVEESDRVSGWLKRTKSVQEEIKYIQVPGHKQIQKKCLSKYCPKNFMSNYKLGKKVAEILRNLDELEADAKPLLEGITIPPKPRHKPTKLPLGKTVGLDSMVDKVWSSIEETNVRIIGLYGMGGVGKTTLLKKINNKLGERSGFYIIWVTVSKSPNLDSIMDDIRKSVGIGDDIWKDCGGPNGKVAKIYDVLQKEKFVLLLDDIWKGFNLEEVGVPLPEETNSQSKVLFTTRYLNVCKQMKAKKKFEVKILSKEEALELFCMRVGEEFLTSNPTIKTIAEEMAKECKGLPLALTVVGSAMAGVETEEGWRHLLNNLKSSPGLETEVFPILKFSYDRLPDETHRKCFLYCALYPEDSWIQEHDLIDQWIGEGFVDNDGMTSVDDMHNQGGFIIEKLKLSCLLLENDEDAYGFSCEPYVKMHDVIRDMVLWIARDEDRNKKKVIVQEDARAISQANVENWEMVERISFLKHAELWILSKSWTNLRTLLLHFDSNCAINGFQNIQYASQLKVLELKRVEIISAEGIGGLNLLECLSLEVSKLTNAPDMWRELKNLKNLKFFRLHVYDYDYNGVFPLGLISHLHQLKAFRFYLEGVRDEREEEKFVEELECSSKLEELWMDITTKSGLNKLLRSAKLQSCIYGLDLRHVKGQVNGPLLLATMSKIKHLQHLRLMHLESCIDGLDLSVYDTYRLSMLQIVIIYECHTIHHLTWLKDAPRLRELRVTSSSIEEVIKGEITLEDEKDSIFRSLKVLMLDSLPNLRSIHERVLSFPSLRFIRVFGCKNLKKLPFDSNSAKDTLRHIRRPRKWWNNLEWDDLATKATFHSKFESSYY